MSLKISFAATELLEPFGWDFQSCMHPALPQKNFHTCGVLGKKKSELSIWHLYFWGKNTELWGYPCGGSNLVNGLAEVMVSGQGCHSSPSARAACTTVWSVQLYSEISAL